MRLRTLAALVFTISLATLAPRVAQSSVILAESGAARVVSGDTAVWLTRGLLATPEPSNTPASTLTGLLDSVSAELDDATVSALSEGLRRFGWAQREVEPMSSGERMKIRVHAAGDSLEVQRLDIYDRVAGRVVMNASTGAVRVERPELEAPVDRTVFAGLVSPEFWIAQQEHIQKQFFESIMNLDYPGLEAARDAYRSGKLSLALYEVAEYYRRKAQRTGMFQRPDPNPASRTHSGAERVVAHTFGGGDFIVQMGDRIDWQTHPPGAPAAEWLWSFNGHAHFKKLLRGYLATGNERYAKEYVDEAVDFVISCPAPPYSLTRNPVWRNLEAGLRGAIFWPDAFHGFLGSPSFTPQAIQLVLTGLWSHGNYIYNHPAGLRRPSNWSIVDSSGLCGVALYFPEFAEATMWRDASYERLVYQLRLQVYDDGSQYELAPGYHWFCLSRFQQALDLTERTGNELPEEFGRIVESMYEYLMWLTKPDGSMPCLSDTRPGDLRGRMLEAASRFDRQDMLYVGTGGQEGTAPRRTSHLLPEAGYAVMRSDWGEDARYLLYDGGPVGSGHQHEDKLGILVSAFGVNFIVDTGPFVYTPGKWRDHAVGTAGHSTALVDGLGQDRIDRGIEHYAAETPTPHWESTEARDYVVAEYNGGYGPDSVAVVHRRHVLFRKPDYWVVVDEFHGEGEHSVETLFQFATDISVTSDEGGTLTASSPGGPVLTIRPAAEQDASVEIVSGQEEPRVLGWYEPHTREPAPVAAYRTSSRLPLIQAYLLYPTRHAGEAVPTMTTTADGDSLVVEVTRAGAVERFGFGLRAGH